MQSSVTTNCNNSRGTEYKMYFGRVYYLKNDENAQKFIHKLNKQQIK